MKNGRVLFKNFFFFSLFIFCRPAISAFRLAKQDFSEPIKAFHQKGSILLRVQISFREPFKHPSHTSTSFHQPDKMAAICASSFAVAAPTKVAARKLSARKAVSMTGASEGTKKKTLLQSKIRESTSHFGGFLDPNLRRVISPREGGDAGRSVLRSRVRGARLDFN
jgi:hypothetical protein